MDRPTIYLCASSARRPDKRGTGARYSIMAMPRAWEHGDGTVTELVPPKPLLRAVQKGEVSWAFYELELRRRWTKEIVQWDDTFKPGFVFARQGSGSVLHHRTGLSERTDRLIQVRSGDALFCGCAEGKPCHRRIAAEYLHNAGWNVVLDGKPFVPRNPTEKALDATVQALSEKFAENAMATMKVRGKFLP